MEYNFSNTRELYNITGIYRIINIINNKSYIGYSNNIGHRLKQHRNKLNVNKHCNIKLQRAYNKYKINNFIVKVLIKAEEYQLGELEIKFIKEYNSCKKGYNISLGGYSPNSGRKITEKTRLKMRKAAIGRIISKEQIEKTRIAKTGVYPTTGNRIVNINQYDLNNNFIKSYVSISEASRQLNCSRNSIGNCVNNVSKTGAGFIWRKDNL